ncbi:putative CDK4/6 [Lentinula detonsa]|uniref:CDK4/6 n=1 Tax=Lentinula detonsa TaxID=2804962 RepID=A0A9W8NSE4_9AGAR|nr:putative CDK4/6 [Lentinula detonsa]
MNILNELQPQHNARVFPSTGFKTIPDSEIFEEENWPWYTPQSFYPVHIGEILHSQYQVLYKLGYGTTATVWLCQDLCRNKYVCMKAMVWDYSSVQREIEAYEALSKSACNEKQFVRRALDHFVLIQNELSYHFLIHEPLGVNLQYIISMARGRLPISAIRPIIVPMVVALHYIHDAQVIHADLQARNILFSIGDSTVLKDGEEAELKQPSSRKIFGDTVIFETRDLPGPIERWVQKRSQPILCDFGEARTGKDQYAEIIQPPTYRAPEVFLHLPWGKAVDVWNFGCMVWHLIFGEQLFSREDALDEDTADVNQLAQMYALLGPPPPKLLIDSGPRASEFFNEDGSAKGAVPSETLESLLESSLERVKETMTAEESGVFLNFIRKTLTWTAEERASVSDLVNDAWVLSSVSKFRSGT